MAGFEDLIKGALEKQGNPSAEGREAVYASSRQALERMLAKNASMSQDAIVLQRSRLNQAIEDIEAEYVARDAAAAPVATPQAAPEPVQPQAPSPATAPPPMPRMEQEADLSVRVDPGVRPPHVPQPTAPSTPPAEIVETDVSVQADRRQPMRLEDHVDSYRGDVLRERKPYAKILLWTVIVVGIAVAIWWAISFGPAFVKQKLGGSVPNPRPTIESGAFVPDGQDGWVTAFLPDDDAQNVDTSNRARADLFQDGNRTFLRIASNPGSTANTIRIKVPRGIMETIRGTAATFELVLKNAEETPHQFAVLCEFASMGNCGRKRFKITQKVEAFIFTVLVDNASLKEGEDAYLAINTDLSSTGKPIDLFSIRVRPEQ